MDFACHNLKLFPEHGIGEETRDIFTRIEEYTQRELTFDSDALTAFYGIFKAYLRSEQLERYLGHFWGIPIVRLGSGNSEVSSLLHGLLWTVPDDAHNSLVRDGPWPS